jgi:hypothetical protein
LPAAFVAAAGPVLGGQRTLWDEPVVLPLEVVRTAREYARRQVAELRARVFPHLGLRGPSA